MKAEIFSRASALSSDFNTPRLLRASFAELSNCGFTRHTAVPPSATSAQISAKTFSSEMKERSAQTNLKAFPPNEAGESERMSVPSMFRTLGSAASLG